jgi:hypothetical protein
MSNELFKSRKRCFRAKKIQLFDSGILFLKDAGNKENVYWWTKATCHRSMFTRLVKELNTHILYRGKPSYLFFCGYT